MLFLSGCLLGPNFKRPTTAVRAKWIESGQSQVDTVDEQPGEWWTVFKDPVLTRLIELGYLQNLSLRAAGTRVIEERAQLGIAIGEFYPQQQQVTASVAYNRIPTSLPYPFIDNTYWQDAIGAQVGWEIDFWGKLRRGIESADDTYLASVASYDAALVTLTGDIATAYVQIRASQTQLEIARENVQLQRDALRIARARFSYGVVSERDVDQALNVLAATEATLPQLTIQLQQAKNRLSVLLGMPPGQLGEILGRSTTIPIAPASIVVGIPADLLRRRPDLRRAELQAAAQCAQIGFTKADLYPTFSIVGSIQTVASTVGSSGLSYLFNSSSLAYGVGPSVQWNILNYGQITNNVRLQDAKFQEMLINYQNAVLVAQQEVEDGIVEFLESRRQATSLTASVRAAAGALNIAIIQYTDGIADFTTVLTAEENLYQAQNSLVLAQANIPLGLIIAYRAMGGGWQIRDDHDLLPSAIRSEMSRRTNWNGPLGPNLLQPRLPGLPGPSDAGPRIRLPE